MSNLFGPNWLMLGGSASDLLRNDALPRFARSPELK